jgi:protein-L-isoaspartate(D-aspartate) O-methyltransferase
VDRGNYVPSDRIVSAYDDAPLGIGFGQTISAPHMHVKAMEELLPAIIQTTSDRTHPIHILDVGSGSGYLSAAFGRLFHVLDIPEGTVYGMDSIQGLVDGSNANIRKQNDGDLISSGRVHLCVGDGWNGLPSKGPFQAIHVGAGADELPTKLVTQLAVGGRMVIPMDTEHGTQSFYRIDRIQNQSMDAITFHKTDYDITELFPARYVPLVHPSIK